AEHPEVARGVDPVGSVGARTRNSGVAYAACRIGWSGRLSLRTGDKLPRASSEFPEVAHDALGRRLVIAEAAEEPKVARRIGPGAGAFACSRNLAGLQVIAVLSDEVRTGHPSPLAEANHLDIGDIR